jgi:hypothetical protein
MNAANSEAEGFDPFERRLAKHRRWLKSASVRRLLDNKLDLTTRRYRCSLAGTFGGNGAVDDGAEPVREFRRKAQASRGAGGCLSRKNGLQVRCIDGAV